MTSLAFAYPLTPGKAEEWRSWGREIMGSRRSAYEALRRRLGLTAYCMYLQQTPQGEIAIITMEGDDLHRTFQELRMSQDPSVVWFRQRIQELLNGLDLAETSPEMLSCLVFKGPGFEEDEAHYQEHEKLRRLGMVSP